MCSPSTVLGVRFSCPPGTRFQQRSLVCDHENNVQCGEEVEEVEEVEEPRRKREKKGKLADFTETPLHKLTGGLIGKTPVKDVTRSGVSPKERSPVSFREEKKIIGERSQSAKDLPGKEKLASRFPSFSRSGPYEPLQKRNSKKLKKREKYAAKLKRKELIGINATTYLETDARRKKHSRGNYRGDSERKRKVKDGFEKNEGEEEASKGGGRVGGLEGERARLRAIITLQDIPSATPPTPTSSMPTKKKINSSTTRSPKAEVTIKSTYRENAKTDSTSCPHDIASPPSISKTSLPSSKVKIIQPSVKLTHPQPASPSKEDFVHRLKQKSLKKLRASLLSQVWKDERSGGGQLKPGKRGEKREIGILVEADERNRKKGRAGTKPISKTSGQQTNKLFKITGTPESAANMAPASNPDKSREFDEETNRVVAKLISQSGRGLEARSKGRHSLHRTTTTPHPYPPPPSATTQVPYIPYAPEPSPPTLPFLQKNTSKTKPPQLTSPPVQPVMPYSINSIRTGDYVEKTAGLETIPFSR